MKTELNLGAISVSDHKYASLFFDWIIPLHSFSEVPECFKLSKNKIPSKDFSAISRLIPPDDPSEIPPADVRHPEKDGPDDHDMFELTLYHLKWLAHQPPPFFVRKKGIDVFRDPDNFMDENTAKVLEMGNALFLINAFARLGVSAIPVFPHEAAMLSAFPEGKNDAITLSINNIPLINTKKCKWEQISQIKEDSNSRIKLSRFRNFLQDEYSGKSANYIKDSLNVKISDYQEACKKHGFELIDATISVLLEGNTWLAASATTIAGILAGHLPEAGAINVFMGIGKVAITLDRELKKIESYKKQHELAFVFDISQKLLTKPNNTIERDRENRGILK